MQTAIACMLMRGGTSKGLFFRACDLPGDINQRDRVLLAAMGSPDVRQIDGMGGAHPLTSKIGIVSVSDKPGVDLEFLFALESKLLSAQGHTSTFRVLTLNTGMAADISVRTPCGKVQYSGNTRIDGVPGTAAAIEISFVDTAGSVCAALLPTGQPKDRITVTGEDVKPFSVEVTCIDNGMPLVIMRAQDMGISGQESASELNAHIDLKRRLEALRLHIASQMGLGDVSQKNYPKMTLVSAPIHGGTINTRCFIPHVCHESIGVLAAVTVATALKIPDTICADFLPKNTPQDSINVVCIEHPSGAFSLSLDSDPAQPHITRAALLRTARLIMRGEVMIPRAVWNKE